MDYLSLCLICKDENDYLPEWLDYHILMGVERFYIYDNESQVSLRESLHDYIARGWVVVVDIAGSGRQLQAYDHCLQTFGERTKWLGFIDTDEFLVAKTNLDLKDLLRDYEAYGGLAVSSLFFGSNGQKTRPAAGQIASYTQRVYQDFKEFELMKCIVQPENVFLPNSPHDFLFNDGFWCVNENGLRVDGQRFPCSVQKIQLNHYYCRSEAEISLKLQRGRGDMAVSWPGSRFEIVNKLAVDQDEVIIQRIRAVHFRLSSPAANMSDESYFVNLLEVLSSLAKKIAPGSAPGSYPDRADQFRGVLSEIIELKAHVTSALAQRNFVDARNLTVQLLQIVPGSISFLVNLSALLMELDDYPGAWQVLTRAWQYSANNYLVLGGMAVYFLKIKNYGMAESTCRLLLEIAPHELKAMGYLCEALLGQGRYDEGLKVGVPVIEYAALQGELPDGMGVHLIKIMVDYLVLIKDYPGAIQLWQVGVQCQPNDVDVLAELCQVLILAGDKAGARLSLQEAVALDPNNITVLGLLGQVGEQQPEPKKRSH